MTIDEITPQNHPRSKSEALRLAPIEPEEYDALADLFLGESVLAPEQISMDDADRIEVAVVVEDELYDDQDVVDLPEPPEVYAGEHRAAFREPEHAGLDGGSDARAAIEDNDPTIEPGPVQVIGRISPEEDVPFVREGGSGSGLIESAADLLRASRRAVSVRPMVEVVLLGHLPVRATLWVRQYACSVARETDETVALIRAAAGSTAVDLITGGEVIETKPAVSIEHALEKAVHLARRVVLRVDESAEPELLERAEIDQVTILTGADETAVVASYRLIKTLTASWDWEGDGAPVLRMAVMGGTTEQSSDARAKLTRAVESFLDHPIEIVVSAGRIDATGTVNIFRDEVAHPASHILDALVDGCLDDFELGDELMVERPGGDGRESAHPGALERSEPEARSSIALLQEDIEALEALEELTHRVRSSVPARGSDTAVGDRDNRGSACSAFSTSVPGLSGLISGLSVIETRCPTAPGVELARDDAGRVHLVIDDSDAGALAHLHNAKSWVRDHLQLLLRAEPGLVVPSSDPRADSEPTMHLLCEEPRASMSVYTTGVRVYALAAVRVGDVVARVATPIN